MKKKKILYGGLAGVLTSFPIAAIMYLGRQAFNAPLAPFDFFNWITRVLPGNVITWGIDSLNNTLLLLSINEAAAKTSEKLIAFGLFSVAGAVIGAVCFYLLALPKIKYKNLILMLAALSASIPFMYSSLSIGDTAFSSISQILWLLMVFLAWGAALRSIYQQLRTLSPQTENLPQPKEKSEVHKMSRRKFLIYLGGTSAAITLVGTGLGNILAEDETENSKGAFNKKTKDVPKDHTLNSLPNADDSILPVPGTRPEVTPIEDHFSVFIGLNAPEIDTNSWQLPITGLVDQPTVLTLDDLQNNYETRHQYVTLRCISGKVGTNLIGTTLWTGVSLQDVLAGVGIQEEGRYLSLTCADGFYETINLNLVNEDPRIMLAYAWDGAPLPTEHGYPLRVWIPDVYGMKQPKWITGIEVVPHFADGYWVERGWDIFARVNATSVIDTVAVRSIIEKDGQRLIPIGGIAYAGARGISKVEVQVDDGEWQEAQLRQPLSETTWVIWRFEWPYQEGSHTFSVRCFEADGTPQIAERSPLRPRGATGIHTVEKHI